MVKMPKKSIKFALRWSVVVSICTIVGFTVGMFLFLHIDEYWYAELMFLLIFVLGLFVGMGEWFVIHSKVRNSWWWIPATAIGYSVGGFSFFVFVSWLEKFFIRFAYQDAEVKTIVILILTGMLTGILQCLTLGKRLTIILQWALVSGLSHAAVEFLIVYSPFHGNGTVQTIASIIFGIICVLAFSFLTGIFAGMAFVDSETQTV